MGYGGSGGSEYFQLLVREMDSVSENISSTMSPHFSIRSNGLSPYISRHWFSSSFVSQRWVWSLTPYFLASTAVLHFLFPADVMKDLASNDIR